MEELWKEIKGYKGYEVSNLGRIKSNDMIANSKNNSTQIRKGRILKLKNESNGYQRVMLKQGRSTLLVHRLVALAFIKNQEKKPHLNHKDGNKQNNLVENLEWVTPKENVIHSWNNGFIDCSKIGRKLTFQQAKVIRNTYPQVHSLTLFAKKYDVSLDTISKIINNQTYIRER